MSRQMICPICGNETPEGSEYCQVCHVNLSTLPDDVFHTESAPKSVPTVPEPTPETPDTETFDPDQPIPSWLITKFQHKGQNENAPKADIDSFLDTVMGIPDPEKSASPAKVLKPKKSRKKAAEPVYQPPLENVIEPPLVESDGTEKSVPDNIPSLNDFKTLRPTKKWDDPQPDPTAEKVNQQTEKAFETVSAMPMLWREDAPLTELDTPDEETAKALSSDEDEFMNSVSPQKVIRDEDIPAKEKPKENAETIHLLKQEPQPADPALIDTDEYQPESGSLLSDLMNEINSNSASLTPQETKNSSGGTVFYSGNHPEEETGQSEPENFEIEVPADTSGASAEALDQILRGFGFQVEGETSPAADPENEPEKPAPADPEEPAARPEEDSPALNMDGEDPEKADKAEKAETTDAALIESDEDPLDAFPVAEKGEEPEDSDIPWDLFGSQDMSLQQSPEDPEYRTFSRGAIPDEQGSTTYQQRMMSSILGKIVQAENFVPPVKKQNPRAVSIWARLFWALMAIGGAALILLTGIADKITLPASENTAETVLFRQFAETASGNAMIVLDYTPAYSTEMDQPAEDLIRTLGEHTDKLYLSVLNPAVMPGAYKLMEKYPDKLEFSGWWPAGVVSLRSRLASGNIPEQVWLLTSESGSVRDWAEQLSVTANETKLHVLAPGQLEPLLQPYLNSGMITSFMSRSTDLARSGGETDGSARTAAAVLYLAALLPLAWFCGLAAKFLRSDPDYGRKKQAERKTQTELSGKETLNDGQL